MSSYDIQVAQFRGFIKNWWGWNKTMHIYTPSRMTPARPHFSRFAGRHRNKVLGATKGAYCKNFDCRSHMVFKKFRGRTYIPWNFEMPTVIFRAGKMGKKFRYK